MWSFPFRVEPGRRTTLAGRFQACFLVSLSASPHEKKHNNSLVNTVRRRDNAILRREPRARRPRQGRGRAQERDVGEDGGGEAILDGVDGGLRLLDAENGELRYYEDATMRATKGLVRFRPNSELRTPTKDLRGKHGRGATDDTAYYFEVTNCEDEKHLVRSDPFAMRAHSQLEFDQWVASVGLAVRIARACDLSVSGSTFCICSEACWICSLVIPPSSGSSDLVIQHP